MDKITSLLRHGVDEFNMISEGDKIAVGISGGKDSIALLLALYNLSKYYPKKFSLVAICVDMGFENTDYGKISALCREKGIELIIHKTEISKIVFDIRKEPNPCSLCAKLRRGALNNVAVEQGCNKVALGHHQDDVIETFMLSLFYEGRVHCFSPVTYLTNKKITVIRPMIFVPEHSIAGAAGRLDLPVVESLCPANGNTKRQEIKDLISSFEKEKRGFKDKIFTAVLKSNINGWNTKEE